ncbi:MAG: Ig-like domain-containing protein [Rhodoferax sp.]
MKTSEGYSRLLPGAMVVLSSVLAAACGGGDGGRATILGAGEVAVLVPPVVTVVAPLSQATGVSVNTQVISAAFSTAMDPGSLNSGSFTLACPAATPVANTVVRYLASSQTATLTLAAGSSLPSNTLCTASITRSVQGDTGIPLASNFVWQFSTGAIADTTAPTVTGSYYPNGASNLPINTQPGVSFSEAMNPVRLTQQNFSLKNAVSGAVVAGVINYTGVDATFAPLSHLAPGTPYTLTIKGGSGGVQDLAGNSMVNDYVINWSTASGAAALDTTAPAVLSVSPANQASTVSTRSAVVALFNEAMNPLTMNSANFQVAGVTGTVALDALGNTVTFTPASALASSTTYTAMLRTGMTDLAGNPLASAKVWTFTTEAAAGAVPAIHLGTAVSYGSIGGLAGLTNTGTLTQINGDIGSTASSTAMITGFHDTQGDSYTETSANMGVVNGKINTCTNAVTGPTSTGSNAASCTSALQARLDAFIAYLTLEAMPAGANPGSNLANLTLLPGTYTAPDGSFLVQGGNLTLDAQGNANAVWVFQMDNALTVGGPGAAFPQSIILAGGAQAKNVFWQVGGAATINAAGGGTMAGTLITQSGAVFSTAGNTAVVTLNGRVWSPRASVTLANTVINLPGL